MKKISSILVSLLLLITLAGCTLDRNVVNNIENNHVEWENNITVNNSIINYYICQIIL